MKLLMKVYAVVFISILLSLYYIYASVNGVKSELNENIEKLFVTQAKSFALNIDKRLREKIGRDFYTTLKKDEELRQTLENEMAMLITPVYQYVFVLYRDVSGDYRFLLDASTVDKADFDQKLNVDKTFWDRAYTSRRNILVNQSDNENLWVTFLHPIVIGKTVEAVVAIDFSMKFPQEVAHSIAPINKTFGYIFLAIAVMAFILLVQGIISLKNKREAFLDPLTQTYNRNYLRSFLEHVDMAKYQIMMLDIDFFKKINDNYGHKAGDAVLRQVASLIRREIREKDVLIRFGGEEFIVFVNRKRPKEAIAQKIAQRIKEAVAMQRFVYESNVIRMTLSIGLNCAPEKFKTISDAIKYADEMLYAAKRSGRNTIVATLKNLEQNDGVVRRSIEEVKEALDEDRIICFYQPIYDTKTQELRKYEALVRMIDKQGRILTPNFFLPAIVNTNIYNDLTKVVVETVFAKIQSNKVHISVNMNFSDLLNNEIFSMIEAQIQNNKAIASWLTIELLENEKIEAIDLLNERIQRLRAYGVRIAVDDLGSGYSNYDIFKVLEVDIIKIDGSLIKDVDKSDISFKITKSIIALSKDLGLRTVAEYVHSKEVYETLKTMGVDSVQGFYLSKPLERID